MVPSLTMTQLPFLHSILDQNAECDAMGKGILKPALIRSSQPRTA